MSKESKKIESRAHAITELHYGDFYESFDGWTFREFQDDPRALHEWIAFTTVMFCPQDSLVHCGLTRFDNDILYTFDPSSGEFASLGYGEVAGKYEVKIHRSLLMAPDGYVYGATALLHDINDTGNAPGGKLFRYRPGSYRIEVLGVPVPNTYIQSIALDEERMVLYGFTFMPERMFRHDILAGESEDLGLIGSCLFIAQAHRPVVDDSGAVWGTWGSYYSHGRLPTEGHRVCLLRYHPESGRGLEYMQHGLGGPSSTEMVDEAVNGGDGFIYFGTRSGALYRLDPETARCELLGRPGYYTRRLGGIALASDGTMYLAAGDRDTTAIYTFDRRTGRFTCLGPVFDPGRGERPEKIHCLTLDEGRGVLYGGEIDNVRRTSYLWEMKLK